MNMKDTVHRSFSEQYGGTGDFYASSGRINLIGEHTDYNGSFVFPGAIDRKIVVEIRRNGGNRARVFSVNMGEACEFGFNEEDIPRTAWARYIFGVCREIIKLRGAVLGGFDAAFAGDIPLGAGMSSSAALESAFAFALNDIFKTGIDLYGLARIGQATEHNYCGVQCGIMDQFASLFGKASSLIRLDCRSMEYRYFPFNPEGYRLVLLDSCVKHELASSAYNRRRASCENVVRAIRDSGHPGTEYLRDVSAGMLGEVKGKVSEEDYMRAEYVIEETRRVLEVSSALESGDYETVGRKMYETHEGMSRLYQVSCEELDFLNSIALECGVTGSRVMGGGFGGCTINLVRDDIYESFLDTSVGKYRDRFGFAPKIYPVVICDGAGRL